MSKQLAFFIDVDNTLLNNDRVKEAIKKSLVTVLGEEEALHFWRHHDAFRAYEKLVDFPRIIKAYCGEVHKERCEMIFMQIFNAIAFNQALYPESIAVLAHLKTFGHIYLFTEGDTVYQHLKVKKSGLEERVEGVFLYEHKLAHVNEVVKKFETFQKIFIDDRASILNTIKGSYPEIYTINVLQGHYNQIKKPGLENIDMKVQTIADLLDVKKDFWQTKTKK